MWPRAQRIATPSVHLLVMGTNSRHAPRGLLTADQQVVFDKNVADMEKARMNRPQP